MKGRLFFAVIVAVLAYFAYQRLTYKGPTGFGFASTADEIAAGFNLAGKSVLVTGATGGLGWETARVLSAHGATVYVGGRSLAKAEKAVTEIRATVSDDTKLNLVAVSCDLSSLAAVAACGDFIKTKGPLESLILNAGIAWRPEASKTPDGFETTMGVNHLAHFHLTELLLPNLLQAVAPRVVVVASSAQTAATIASMTDPSLGMDDWATGKRGWTGGLPAYGDSKLANILMATELHHRFHEQGLSAYSLDPGEIMTGIVKPEDGWLPWVISTVAPAFQLLMKSPEQGAATQVFCALRATADQSGSFFRNSNVHPLDSSALIELNADRDATTKFWDNSKLLIQQALEN